MLEVHGVITHPEINLQVPAASKLAVADLERDRHLVVLVQGLVEALALVGLHLDVVRGRERDEAARCSEDGEGREQHDWRRAAVLWVFRGVELESSRCGNGQVARNLAGVAKRV
jgi:hypothetical protein